MKVAIVCFNLSWQSGGPRLIFSAAQAMKKAGHQVAIYAPEFSGLYYKDLWHGLDIRIVPPPRPLAWVDRSTGLFGRLLEKLRNERSLLDLSREIASAIDADCDIVNVHDFAYPVGWFAKRRNPGIRVVWTENDPPFAYLPKKNRLLDILSRTYNAWKERSSRKYFRAIDRVSVLDFYNRDWCLARDLRPEVIRLGVDFDKFYLPAKDVGSLVLKKEVRLFALGSLNVYRHYEDIIRAVGHLRRAGYDARATIVANDQWHQPVYRATLEGLRDAEGLGGSVELRFAGVSDQELKELYRNHDVFVYPMYVPPPRNGFGFSIGVMEAIAAGLPVVMCRTTTCAEVLRDRETVLLVDPESPDQIADQIAWLMKDAARYRRIAEAGQAFVRRELTWENYAKSLIGLLVTRT